MFSIKSSLLLKKCWNNLVKIMRKQKPLNLRKSYFFEKLKNLNENI